MVLDGLVGAYFLPFVYKSSAPRERRGGMSAEGREAAEAARPAERARKPAERARKPAARKKARISGPRPRFSAAIGARRTGPKSPTDGRRRARGLRGQGGRGQLRGRT